MRRRNNEKSKFIILIALLFVLALGIGYAVLTEKLTINNTISYDSMKWDVGFSSVGKAIGWWDEESAIDAEMVISEDRKSLSYVCDLGTETSSKLCTGIAVVSNNSSFDVALENISFSYGDTSQELFYSYFNYFGIWDNNTEDSLGVGYVLKAGESVPLLIGGVSKELTEDMLTEEGLSLNFGVTLDWVEFSGADTISFKIDGATYTAEKNMSWFEWVNSDFNKNEYTLGDCDVCGGACEFNSNGNFVIASNDPYFVIHHVDGVYPSAIIESKDYILAYWEDEYACFDGGSALPVE